MAEGFDPKLSSSKIPDVLLCGICLDVLKDPVVCGENEHCYCRHCITRYVNENQQCPLCREYLTSNTLGKPSKVIKSMLASLRVHCKYVERGCEELICLEFIDKHHQECHFSPVQCRNENCREEVNKRDLEHHEKEVCLFRKERCHECFKIVVEIDQLKKISATMNDKQRRMNTKLDRITQNQEHLSQNQEQMATKLSAITRNQAKFSQNQNIFSQQQQYMDNQLQNILKMSEDLTMRQERLERAMVEVQTGIKEQLSMVNNKAMKNIKEKNEKYQRNIKIAGSLIAVGLIVVGLYYQKTVDRTNILPDYDDHTFPISYY